MNHRLYLDGKSLRYSLQKSHIFRFILGNPMLKICMFNPVLSLHKLLIVSMIICKNQYFPSIHPHLSFRTRRNNQASTSIADVLISPMSRLSTSSSIMSFNNSRTNLNSIENLFTSSNDLQQSAAAARRSSNRTSSMPTWRGYLPMKFEPITMDQYQMTSHFSQKVFLGGIPAELTEGSIDRSIEYVVNSVLFLFCFS